MRLLVLSVFMRCWIYLWSVWPALYLYIYMVCMCVCFLCVDVLRKNTLPTLLWVEVGVMEMQHPHLHQATASDSRHQQYYFSLQSSNCASVTWSCVFSHLLYWLKTNSFSLLRFLKIWVNSTSSSLSGYPQHICFCHIPCSSLTTVTLFRVSWKNTDISDFWMTSVPSAHTVKFSLNFIGVLRLLKELWS